jgi:hypothetical protein
MLEAEAEVVIAAGGMALVELAERVVAALA